MPTNLNALIRYKRIDACLRNPYVDCTIERLRRVCTDAIDEHRGNRVIMISERTIRDDIRVMRSDILGFNAPIAFEGGKYVYTDNNYSLFRTPINEMELLKEIFKMLLSERNNIADTEIEHLLMQLSDITGLPVVPVDTESSVEKEKSEKISGPDITDDNACSDMLLEDDDNFSMDYLPDSLEVKHIHFSRIQQRETVPWPPEKPLLFWEEILKIL
jgi:hypothetical protein